MHLHALVCALSVRTHALRQARRRLGPARAAPRVAALPVEALDATTNEGRAVSRFLGRNRNVTKAACDDLYALLKAVGVLDQGDAQIDERELREEDREGCERVDHEEATRIDQVAGLGRRLTSARERLASARRRSDEA